MPTLERRENMAESVGQIGLDLVINQNQFQSQLNGIKSVAKKAGAVIASAFAVKGIVNFGKECLELGSDLAEVQNVVDVAFPNMSSTIDKFAKSAAAQFGLSETMAKRYAGTFGSMASAFGFTEKEAANMSTTLTGLAGDVASFYNISQDEAYTKIKSVFTGETESLKDLGVVMTQTALDQYALANGYGKTTAKMNEQEKVALRYAFVQQQLSNATGDFTRTSDSWANQTRLLALQFDSLKASLGQGLINVFTPVIKAVNVLLGKLATLASAFKAFTDLITGNKNAEKSATGIATGMENASAAASDANSNVKSIGDTATKTAKKVEKSLAGFDKINKLTEPTSDDSSSGSNGSNGSSVAGSQVDYGSLNKGETELDGYSKKFAKIFKDMQKELAPTTEALKKLYNEGLSKLAGFSWNALKGFYTNFLVPVAKWTLGKGLPEFISALNDGLNNINYGKIEKSLNNLWKALTPFAINVGEGLLWFWKNVLVPLGTWTANEVVPRFLETLKNAINILNAVIEALKPLFKWLWDNVLTKIASWTAGAFTTIWDGINGVLNKFSDWCEKHPGTIRTATVAVAGFMAAWKAIKFGEFIVNAGGIVSILEKMKKAISACTVAKIKDNIETAKIVALYAKDAIVKAASTAKTIALTVAQKAAALAQKALNIVMNANPLALIVVAVTALIAAFVLLYNKCDWFKKAVDKIWKGIKSAFFVCFDAIKEFLTTTLPDAFSKLKEKIDPILQTIVGIVKTYIESIQTVINGITTTAKGVVDFITGVFSGDWKKAWDGIKGIFSGFFTALKGILATVGTVISGPFKVAWSAISTTFKGMGSWFQTKYDAVKTVFVNVGTFFSEKFTGAYDKVKNAFSGVKTFFKDNVWGAIKDCFSNVVDWFRTKFSAAWTAVKNVFSTGGKIFTGIKEGIADTFKTVVNKLIDGINKIIKVPFDSINGMLNKIRGVGIGKVKPFESLWSENPISTPQIPKLAQGGFVKKNTPQLAMIGDNRHQGEVVAPENKLQAMVDEAVSKAGGNGVTKDELARIMDRAVIRIIAALSSVGFNIDGEQLARLEKAKKTALDRRFNNVTIV